MNYTKASTISNVVISAKFDNLSTSSYHPTAIFDIETTHDTFLLEDLKFTYNAASKEWETSVYDYAPQQIATIRSILEKQAEDVKVDPENNYATIFLTLN